MKQKITKVKEVLTTSWNFVSCGYKPDKKVQVFWKNKLSLKQEMAEQFLHKKKINIKNKF